MLGALAAAGLLLDARPAAGQVDQSLPQEALTDESDTVGANLRRRESLRDLYEGSRLGRWLSPVEAKRQEWFERLRLEILTSYDAVAQYALGSGRPHFASSGDLTLSGQWLIWDRGRDRFEWHLRVPHKAPMASPSWEGASSS